MKFLPVVLLVSSDTSVALLDERDNVFISPKHKAP
jgi:hypothetical protein